MNLTVLWNLLVTGILRGGLYALMAGGLALLFGVMNICNFAHGELFVVGAYVAYFAYVTFGLPPLLAILIAAGASFLVGALLEKSLILPLRRRSKGEWIMNTFLRPKRLDDGPETAYFAGQMLCAVFRVDSV